MSVTEALLGPGTGRTGTPRGMLGTPPTCAEGTWGAVRHRFAGQSGVALLEVLVSSMIVSIAVVGVALMFATGQAYITAEGDNRVALFLAQQKIEQLRALSYAGLNTGTGSEDPVCNYPTPPPDPLPECAYPGYKRTWSVVCVERDNYNLTVACSATSPGKKIMVTVQTSPLDPRSTPVTLQSVLANR